MREVKATTRYPRHALYVQSFGPLSPLRCARRWGPGPACGECSSSASLVVGTCLSSERSVLVPRWLERGTTAQRGRRYPARRKTTTRSSGHLRNRLVVVIFHAASHVTPLISTATKTLESGAPSR